MRLDVYAAQKFSSRSKAAAAIKRGAVLVNGRPRDASYEVKEGDEVQFLDEELTFVSAGGYKLHKALCEFGLDIGGMVFADIGASTGGFTDCLFKAGAQKVYCIDVGESQLDASLLNCNVVVIDGFNARNLSRGLFAEELDGVTIDVSFISLTYILQPVADILGDGKFVFALIKPQFECESRNVGKNGILRGADRHRRVIEKIYNFALSCNLAPKAITRAPEVKGKNVEYVILLEKGGVAATLSAIISSAGL